MLKKKYPNFSCHQFSIDDILSWELWPTFLKMHGRSTGLHYEIKFCVIYILVKQKSLAKEGLTKDDQKICDTASIIFTGVCLSVLDGSVPVNVLKKLKNKQDEVQRLCEAITSQTKQPTGNQEQLNFSYESISESLNIRLSEYSAFIEHQEKLSTLVQHLADLNIPGKFKC